jgi:predicted AAA+ superfamily ATPase
MTQIKSDYIPREIEKVIKARLHKRPIMLFSGPRQCGKSRLIKEYFPHLKFYDFEHFGTREMIRSDINGFVEAHSECGAIFDEFQLIPEITEALKVEADNIIFNAKSKGIGNTSARFILSGSHNYLMDQAQKETMVGRCTAFKMSTFSAWEMNETDLGALMFKGGYPEVFMSADAPSAFFTNYLENYLDREVLQVHKIEDLDNFENFMKK